MKNYNEMNKTELENELRAIRAKIAGLALDRAYYHQHMTGYNPTIINKYNAVCAEIAELAKQRVNIKNLLGIPNVPYRVLYR